MSTIVVLLQAIFQGFKQHYIVIIKRTSPLPRGRGCDNIIIIGISLAFIRGVWNIIIPDPVKSKPVFNYKTRTHVFLFRVIPIIFCCLNILFHFLAANFEQYFHTESKYFEQKSIITSWLNTPATYGCLHCTDVYRGI